MEPTTGLILRRITQTNLSVAAHKLATLILDAIAWKDGYNGLSRGTAAFTLSALAERMGVSRQYLSVLLSELETSELQLERAKPNGKFAPWIFRFSAFDEESETHVLVSDEGDTSLSRDNNNKTKVESINLEVYEKMAHKQFEKIIKEANFKWNLIDTLIIHRYGNLQVNDKIVLVASFSSHRKDSFEACNFIMDYLKKDAPFWKNEFYDKKNEWLINTN